MCGLCGVLGGPAHWSEGSAWLDGAPTRRAERQRQVRLCNTLLAGLRLKLDDWQGSSFVLSSPTGRHEVLSTLPEIWAMAERMAKTQFEPLDPEFWAQIGERQERR